MLRYQRMACPFFEPVEPQEEFTGVDRLPLIEAWRGRCLAEDDVCEPDDATWRQYCLFGYARGRCGRFPDDAKTDAVRFSVAAGPEQGRVRIQYVTERDCAPVQYGFFELPIGGMTCDLPSDARLLRVQAQAFERSYCRRRGTV